MPRGLAEPLWAEAVARNLHLMHEPLRAAEDKCNSYSLCTTSIFGRVDKPQFTSVSAALGDVGATFDITTGTADHISGFPQESFRSTRRTWGSQ